MLLSRWLPTNKKKEHIAEMPPLFLLRWPITSQETVLFGERIPWFDNIDSVKELAAQRGAFAATLKVVFQCIVVLR